MNLNRIFPITLALSLAGVLPTHATTLAIGQPAPRLTFTKLYGAPDGTKTDWSSLQGKVVVLEFWATWCAPCIAEIPHLNELAQSVAANNVQFIAIDDEDPAVVEKFLAKKHMAGWVGLDTSKKVFGDYGVDTRPTTIVIDTKGRIAATLNPQQLVKDQLVALASGKSIVVAPDSRAAAILAAKKAIQDQLATRKNPAGSVVKPLFEFSIHPGDPNADAITFATTDKATGQLSYDLNNAPLSMLIPWAAQLADDRVVVHGDADKPHYNLHLIAQNLDLDQLSPLLQPAIAAAAGVKLTRHTGEEDAYVLQATARTAARLSPTVSNHGSMCFYDPHDGKLTMVKTSLNDLASTIESALGTPVVNEAGISGEFDTELSFPKGDFDAAKAALETNLGLTLVKARRPIERIVLDPLPAKLNNMPQATSDATPAAGRAIQRHTVTGQQP